MKGLVYHGPGKKSWESKDDPNVERASDAIVKIYTTTICGTDLHILKGDVPAVTDGRTLGHEAVGTVVETATAVDNVKEGDKVLVSCISSCADGRLDPTVFATHRFSLGEIEEAYEVFSDAAHTNALKVVLSAP